MTELADLRLVVFDFDGVFTDNRVWTNERGEESVACWRGDALGLRRLEAVGVEHLILSTEVNQAVGARARKIRATCIQAVEAGCEAAVILDGRVGHAMLLEFFTSRGAGTLVRAG